MKRGTLELGEQVLDRQIVDADDLPCGKVDDLEMRADDAGLLHIEAILVGPGAALPRLPVLLEVVGQKILGRRVVRIPWDRVESIGDTVKLKSRAGEHGLDPRHNWAGKFIRKLPLSWKASHA
jgi:sporulation protein YlmC with PRC-barrel domain